ncbi:hypothetical protein ACFL3K_02435 [Pseudomonadota bacterium]
MTDSYIKKIEVKIALCCVAYALLIHIVAAVFGLNSNPEIEGYTSYFSKLNWSLYPLFFLLMAPLLVWVDSGFFKAWEGLRKTEVLRAEPECEVDDSDMKCVRQQINKWRPIILLLALLLSAGANIYESGKVVSFYSGEMNFSEQVVYAGEDPDFFTHWWPGTTEHSASSGDWALFLLIYLQQFIIATMGIYVLLQLIFHPIFFGLFNHLEIKNNGKSLRIRLSHNSPVREFGLEHWNQRLNNIYWYLCVALSIPIISKLSQTKSTSDDEGQIILKVAVSVLLLAPMVANIISRQVHLPHLWEELRSKKPDDADSFHDQRLWPLDRNWASKLGIVLAFTLSSLFLGSEFFKLLKV